MVVTNRDVNASLPLTEFQSEHFDERCAAKGATTELARAELVGKDRRTLHRWRKDLAVPTVDDALSAAEVIDTTVEKLWRLRRSPR